MERHSALYENSQVYYYFLNMAKEQMILNQNFLTCLRDAEVLGVALPPIQVAAIGANFELICVASL